MFAKDSININLGLERSNYLPGQVVSGHISVHTQKETECTAIRVKFTCKMTTRLRISEQRTNNGQTETETNTYEEDQTLLKHTITCYGFPKSSGRKGGCFLTPGTAYSYDFNYQIPITAPGTVSYDHDDAECYIVWAAEGYVDIPGGFDATQGQAFTVGTPAPTRQALSGPVQLKPQSQEVYSCGCTGCLCSSTGEHVHVAPIISHPIVLVGPDTYSNSEQANVLGVRVEVTNDSEKAQLATMRATLTQNICITAQGHVETFGARLGQVEVGPDTASGSVQKEEFAAFAGTMPVFHDIAIPFMQAPLCSVSTTLCIDFPGVKLDELSYTNCVFIATAEDCTDQSPPMPRPNYCATQETEQQL